MRRRLRIVIVMGVLLCSAGCDSADLEGTLDEAHGEFGFVGALSGTDALVGILISDTSASVYVCSSEDEISEWIAGAVGARTQFDLTNSAGASVTAQFAGESFTGEIKLRNGSRHSFAASAAGSGEGGIYRIDDDAADDAGVTGGWIVSATGMERGAFRIRSVFQKAPSRPRPTFPTDGTSNTVVISESRFRFFRLSSG